MLVLVSLAVASIAAHHSPSQDSRQSTASQSLYLPTGQTDASILPLVLASLREPSLLEAAKDATVRSFRVTFFSPVPEHEVAIRLIVNSDGSGQITSAVRQAQKQESDERQTMSLKWMSITSLSWLIRLDSGQRGALSRSPTRMVASIMFLMGHGGCWKECKTARFTMSSVEIQNQLQSQKLGVTWQGV